MLKTLFFALMIPISLNTFGQEKDDYYLNKINEALSKNDCESAQVWYENYKNLNGESEPIEKLINDCLKEKPDTINIQPPAVVADSTSIQLSTVLQSIADSTVYDEVGTFTMEQETDNSKSKKPARQVSKSSVWGIRASYSPMMKFSTPEEEDFEGINADATGMSIGLVNSVRLFSKIPLFVETGANVQWINSTFIDETFRDEYIRDESSLKFKMLSTNASVNFMYKYALSNKIFIFPYMGLNFKINTYGRFFGRYVYVYDEVTIEDEEFTVDIFDKEEMGEAFRRFQIGWHIGGGFYFNKFYISANYGKNFNDLSETMTLLPNAKITLGFDF